MELYRISVSISALKNSNNQFLISIYKKNHPKTETAHHYLVRHYTNHTHVITQTVPM